VTFSAPSRPESSFTIPEEETLLSHTTFVFFAIVCLVVIIICAGFNFTTAVTPIHGLYYGIISGVSGGICYVITTLAFDAWGTSGVWSEGLFYLYWVLACVFELLNVVSLNIGMFKTQAMVVIPAYYVFQTISSSALGLSLFGLFPLFSASSGVAYTIGIIFIFLGVLMISKIFSPRRREKMTMKTERMKKRARAATISDLHQRGGSSLGSQLFRKSMSDLELSSPLSQPRSSSGNTTTAKSLAEPLLDPIDHDHGHVHNHDHGLSSGSYGHGQGQGGSTPYHITGEGSASAASEPGSASGARPALAAGVGVAAASESGVGDQDDGASLMERDIGASTST
jgi:hypothetical protein